MISNSIIFIYPMVDQLYHYYLYLIQLILSNYIYFMVVFLFNYDPFIITLDFLIHQCFMVNFQNYYSSYKDIKDFSTMLLL